MGNIHSLIVEDLRTGETKSHTDLAKVREVQKGLIARTPDSSGGKRPRMSVRQRIQMGDMKFDAGTGSWSDGVNHSILLLVDLLTFHWVFTSHLRWGRLYELLN